MRERPEPPKTDKLRERAWSLAFDADGTAAIFDMRALNRKRRIQGLTFASLVIPLVVGSAVLAGLPKQSLLPYFLGVPYPPD